MFLFCKYIYKIKDVWRTVGTELRNSKFVMCHDVYTGLKYSWLSTKKSLMLSLLTGQTMEKVFILFSTFISKTLICYIAGNLYIFSLEERQVFLTR